MEICKRDFTFIDDVVETMFSVQKTSIKGKCAALNNQLQIGLSHPTEFLM